MSKADYMGPRQAWTNRIVFFGAFCFAVTFSAISILNVDNLNNALTVLLRHPMRASSAVYSLRLEVSSMEIEMGKLVLYNNPEGIQDINKNITRIKSDIASHFSVIAEYYLGPREHVTALEALLQKIFQAQESLLSRAESISSQEIGKILYTEISPYYKNLKNLLYNDILEFINGTVSRLSAVNVMGSSVAVSLVMSVLLLGVVYIFLRLNDKRNAEKTYHEHVFKIISENVGNVFMLYDVQQHSIDYVSPNSQKVLGLESSELMGDPTSILACVASSHKPTLATLFGNEILHSNVSLECLFANPQTKAESWMAVHIYPLRKQNVVTRYVIVFSDLTEVRKTQQVLRDALLNAQNANKAKSDFLSRMSHEIRTPMNAIIGMTTIAATSLENPSKLEDCLTKISGASRHLLMLINDILDMSKIESDKLTLVHEPFQLADLISSVTTIVYPQARTKGVEFDVSIVDVPHERLNGDPLRLSQILLNILSNAIKFTPAGGFIRLHIREEKASPSKVNLNFTITDTGSGMSPAFLERLFLPFEQEQPGTSGGTGLGMAITHNMVSLMHGTIRVHSQQGKGTTFAIKLPFEISGQPFDAENPALESLKILVVDDDKDTCEHTALILNRIGMQADWVLSGSEAVAMVIKAYDEYENYDVIFMDWKMPDVDGIEATRRIRRHVGHDTLIIIISAYDWKEIEAEARSAGANAFISKPMFQSTLYNTLVSVSRNVTVVNRNKKQECPDLTGKRLLLAEDNDLNREIAVELLSMTGAEVDAAINGEEVLRMFSQSEPGTYAAVFMDVQMPIMDGYQASRAIRALTRSDAASVPIIAMTANAFAEDVTAALDAGMNYHLGKPIDLEHLYRTLEKEILN